LAASAVSLARRKAYSAFGDFFHDRSETDDFVRAVAHRIPAFVPIPRDAGRRRQLAAELVLRHRLAGRQNFSGDVQDLRNQGGHHVVDAFAEVRGGGHPIDFREPVVDQDEAQITVQVHEAHGSFHQQGFQDRTRALQCRLRLPALGDIPREGDQARPLLVDNAAADHVRVEHRAVFSHQGDIIAAGCLPVRVSAEDRGNSRPLAGRVHAEHRQGGEFLLGISEHPAEGRIDSEKPLRFDVDDADSVRHPVIDGLQLQVGVGQFDRPLADTLFQFCVQAAQFPFGLFALRDVLHLGDEVSGPSLGVSHQGRGHLAINHMTQPMAVAFFKCLAGLLPPHRLLDERLTELRVFGQRQIIDRHAFQLLPAVAEDLGHLVVDLQEPALQVHQAHSGIGVAERQAKLVFAFPQRLRVHTPAAGAVRTGVTWAVPVVGAAQGRLQFGDPLPQRFQLGNPLFPARVLGSHDAPADLLSHLPSAPSRRKKEAGDQ